MTTTTKSDHDDAPTDLSQILGSTTGEPDRDTVPGGWDGTDDATSTAPSDLCSPANQTQADGPEEGAVEGYVEGLDGTIVDIKGTPVDGPHDWSLEPIVTE